MSHTMKIVDKWLRTYHPTASDEQKDAVHALVQRHLEGQIRIVEGNLDRFAGEIYDHILNDLITVDDETSEVFEEFTQFSDEYVETLYALVRRVANTDERRFVQDALVDALHCFTDNNPLDYAESYYDLAVNILKTLGVDLGFFDHFDLDEWGCDEYHAGNGVLDVALRQCDALMLDEWIRQNVE